MTFTNIQVYNLFDKFSNEELENKIKNIYETANLKFSTSSKFVTVQNIGYKFKTLNENKSFIRKLSKKLTLPIFSITCLQEEHIIIEQYNFNKRTYDYISIGNMYENLKKVGYEKIDSFNNISIWTDYFVGKNNIEDINKIIANKDIYSKKSYIIEEIFKLYGLSKENSLSH